MNIPNIKIKRILYPTDLSDLSRFSYAYATSLAEHYDAEIILMNVINEKTRYDERLVGYIQEDVWENIKIKNQRDARAALLAMKRDRVDITEISDISSENSIAEEPGSTPRDRIMVVVGNPVEQILAQSRKWNCDLIIIGAHGRGALEDTVIGSTARRVLRRSHIPVLVIRDHDNLQ